MALIWERNKLAVDIIDDPLSTPFDGLMYPDCTVVHVTSAQLEDDDEFFRICELLYFLLGDNPIDETPEWRYLIRDEDMRAVRNWR